MAIYIGTNEGVCSKCKSEDIEYGSSQIVGMSLGYEVSCNKCFANGWEWYGIEYHETRMEGNDES